MPAPPPEPKIEPEPSWTKISSSKLSVRKISVEKSSVDDIIATHLDDMDKIIEIVKKK